MISWFEKFHENKRDFWLISQLALNCGNQMVQIMKWFNTDNEQDILDLCNQKE